MSICVYGKPFRRQRFGGVSVLLFGDFWQLPPVLDKAMYSDLLLILSLHPNPGQGKESNKEEYTVGDEDWSGYHAYQTFGQSIELTVQQRQDPAQVDFVVAVEGLRDSTVTVPHWETLSRRYQV